MENLKVVTLNETNFRDIAKTMRIIADGIESGEFGIAHTAAIVITGSEVSVFHLGAGDVSDAVFALHVGAHKLVGAAAMG